MHELIGQLLAAIFGAITANLKITPKTKYLAGITTGLVIFIVYYLVDYFYLPPNINQIYNLLIFSLIFGILFFFLFWIAEFFDNRKLRKQKKENNKLD